SQRGAAYTQDLFGTGVLQPRRNSNTAELRRLLPQMGGFGQDRFRAHDTRVPPVEEADALFVAHLAPIEDGDECAGVEEGLTGHASGIQGRTPGASGRGRGLRTPASR